ncbi:hypothetical protein GGH96_005802 [Coemansia sp. RSA 1972]|nr:hypothetical protein GGH96_005802 [Coemansia sp. RSA 1972]
MNAASNGKEAAPNSASRISATAVRHQGCGSHVGLLVKLLTEPSASTGRSRDNVRDRWTHDRFDTARSINDRVDGQRKINDRIDRASNGKRSINDRLGTGRSSRESSQDEARNSARGVAIARSKVDPAPYNEMRVVWVTGIPHEYTEEKLEGMFRDAGRVDTIRMAVDVRGRFVGKAELVYRQADDARTAIQVFDGETLYSVDSRQVMMHVAYSSVKNAEYVNGLRFENTLPAPRSVGVEERLGVVPVFVDPAAPFMGVAQSRNGQSGRKRGDAHGRRNDSRSNVTAEQLDAEMDAYMASSTEKAPAPSTDTMETT